MSYALFIDDTREPSFLTRWDAPAESREFARTRLYPWIVVRDYDEAVSYIRDFGWPQTISFDHDIGHAGNGHDVLKAMIEMVLDGELEVPDDFEWYVHSQNPTGAENIRGLMQSFLRSR